MFEGTFEFRWRGPVVARGLVDNRDMRGDPALTLQPIEHVASTIGGFSDQALGCQIKPVVHRSIMVRTAPSSACRIERVASTSKMIE